MRRIPLFGYSTFFSRSGCWSRVKIRVVGLYTLCPSPSLRRHRRVHASTPAPKKVCGVNSQPDGPFGVPRVVSRPLVGLCRAKWGTRATLLWLPVSDKTQGRPFTASVSSSFLVVHFTASGRERSGHNTLHCHGALPKYFMSKCEACDGGFFTIKRQKAEHSLCLILKCSQDGCVMSLAWQYWSN